MAQELKSIRNYRRKNCHDRRYCNEGKEDDLYLTVADGDFSYPNKILEDVKTSVNSGNMAYRYEEPEIEEAIIKWYKNEYDVNIKNEEILIGRGVLYWVHILINYYTEPGENVLVMSPVYSSFLNVISDKTKRKLLENHLIYKDKKWSIDFDDLEEKMKMTKIMIFCSPHNPTGNVWTGEDLKKINQLAIKHNVVIVTDEIWQDIILEGKFVNCLSLKDQSHIVHVSSPTKTYNICSLSFGHLICKSPKRLKEISEYHDNVVSYSSSQPWVTAAVKSAYLEEDNKDWLKLYIKQIKENSDRICKELNKFDYEFAVPEGTYLIFCKLGNSKLYGDRLIEILGKLGVHVQNGNDYGKTYDKWVRIDIAICSSSMDKLIKILNNFHELTK